jgi:hypothetical protein
VVGKVSLSNNSKPTLSPSANPITRLGRSPNKRRNRHREGLLLARKRLVDQMQSATRPEHLRMLQQSLAELDRQLSSFDDLTDPPAPK